MGGSEWILMFSERGATKSYFKVTTEQRYSKNEEEAHSRKSWKCESVIAMSDNNHDSLRCEKRFYKLPKTRGGHHRPWGDSRQKFEAELSLHCFRFFCIRKKRAWWIYWRAQNAETRLQTFVHSCPSVHSNPSLRWESCLEIGFLEIFNLISTWDTP